MDRHIGIFRSRSDGKGMPLELGDFGALEEEPLTGSVLEAWLGDPEFHGTRGVNEDFVELGSTTSTDLTIDAFAKVNDARPDGSTPGHVSEADIGVVKGECVCELWQGGTTDKASSGVGVEADHEEKGEMMGVPESLEALLADLVVGGRVHDDHEEEHDMTGDSTRLLVVDVKGISRTELATLDVDKVDIVGSSVDHCPESHRVRDLTMEPNVLICGEEPSHVRANDPDNVPEHGDEDEEAIETQDETSTPRSPHGEFERVETCKSGICHLGVPSIGKSSEMETVKDDVEQEAARGEDFRPDPFFDMF